MPGSIGQLVVIVYEIGPAFTPVSRRRRALGHDWACRHFPDKDLGEWYGYLNRDEGIGVPLKGNLWKGPFHLPRMQLVCWRLLEEMRGARLRKDLGMTERE